MACYMYFLISLFCTPMVWLIYWDVTQTKSKILSLIGYAFHTEYIQDLKRSYEETQLPVTDDSVPLHKLCAKLEYMLQIDMKRM